MNWLPYRNLLRQAVLVAIVAALFLPKLTHPRDAQRENRSDLFNRSVAPILEQNCFVCHGEGTRRSDLDLRTPESIRRGGSRGPAFEPGNAESSVLYQLITHTLEPHMPMGGAKLAASEIQAIAEWINSLPPEENRTQPPAGSTHIRRAGYQITPQDRQFWSFQRPVRTQIPSVKNSRWVRNEIDAFVLRHLEEKGLTPSPPAEPLVLLRRLYSDLIGLPPSPEETEAYLADRSGRAYENAIDRLLASPHYGERWGRHWLDLARYADSGGFEFDYDRPNAWRYRDYVIRAFTEDKPYDQFIKEQLAADELDPGNPAALIATGFCRNGPTVDNASNEQTRMDELDDIVSTTSAVFMGLTIGCARCHDHKYDPIPQRDYYRMQAIFFPSRKTDKLLVSPAEEAAFKSRNKEVDEKVKPYREQVAAIEKPHRERLLAEKVELFTRIAARAGALEGKDPEQYRKGLAEQFAKDVKLQPEEIQALLSPDEIRARKVLQDEIDRINKSRPKPLPAAMGITDTESKPAKCFLLERGDFRQKGEEVQPGFPSVLAGDSALIQPAPSGAKTSHRRKQLAEWIGSPEHPLTARVAVNRIWHYHFGKGIVRTASDFGINGDRPSHPGLLDWLATELVARGWSFKAMHRLILTSNTYRQSSRFRAKAVDIDPENRLLWRTNPRRLEAEIIRDNILIASGQLNRDMAGPGIFPRIDSSVISTGSTHKWPVNVTEGPAEWRRSVYIFVKRSVALPLMEVFDCPDTTVSTPARSSSTIAPQALALLNNDFVLEQAGHFARRLLKDAGANPRAQVKQAYRIALVRNPTSREIDWGVDFLLRQARAHLDRVTASSGKAHGGSFALNERPRGSSEPSPAQNGGEWSTATNAPAPSTSRTIPASGPEPSHTFAALRDFCHALFNLNEFIYVD